MKKYLLVATLLLGIGGATAVFADGEWLRSGPVWFKGLVYAGTSKVAITNAAGNLSTTSLALSGNETVGGNLVVTGTAAVTGAVTLKNATLILSSVAAGVTASTESAQSAVAASGAMTTLATQATTVGTAGDSITLPTGSVGELRMVCNAAAANAMDLFPNLGGQINKESAGTAISLAAGECATCLAFSSTRYGCTIGTAN